MSIKRTPAPQVPITPAPDIKVTVRLPFPQYSNARQVAADRGQSFNAWICGVIDEAIRKV